MDRLRGATIGAVAPRRTADPAEVRRMALYAALGLCGVGILALGIELPNVLQLSAPRALQAPNAGGDLTAVEQEGSAAPVTPISLATPGSALTGAGGATTGAGARGGAAGTGPAGTGAGSGGAGATTTTLVPGLPLPALPSLPAPLSTPTTLSTTTTTAPSLLSTGSLTGTLSGVTSSTTTTTLGLTDVITSTLSGVSLSTTTTTLGLPLP